jgi:hypothetical protein
MIHALLVAYAVALVEVSIQPGEAGHLVSLIRPIAMIASILAVWMLAQTIPLPIKSWAHPIWASAETALDNPIAGSITIDLGATLVAICRYFSAIAILFVAVAVTIDRMRAEWVLFWPDLRGRSHRASSLAYDPRHRQSPIGCCHKPWLEV